MDKRNPSELERLGPEIPVKTTAVPMGLPGVNRRTVDGFVLMTGIVLLESERDGQGRDGWDVSADTAPFYAGEK